VADPQKCDSHIPRLLHSQEKSFLSLVVVEHATDHVVVTGGERAIEGVLASFPFQGKNWPICSSHLYGNIPKDLLFFPNA